jgi:hypothetical protein
MKLCGFVYYPLFDRAALRLMTDDDQITLEDMLRTNPRAGDVIPDTDGARKIRIGVQGRGKSGGARAIYIFIEIAETFHMLLCYPKNVRGNLTNDQKKALRAVIGRIKEEVHRAAGE